MKKILFFLMMLAAMLPWALNAQVTVDFESNSLDDLSALGTVTNSTTHPWTVVNPGSSFAGYNGSYCMKSSNSGVASSESSIEVEVLFLTDGSISFLGGCWGEGSSSVWDKCLFYIDGEQKFSNGALASWATYNYTVTAGTHVFKWSYSKDGSVNPTGDAFLVDDIVIDGMYIPTCPAPAALAVSDITSYGTTFSWSPRGSSTSWEVYCDTGNVDMSLVSGTTVIDTFYTFTGLQANTQYRAYVRSVCPGEYSQWRSVSFTTLCDALTTLPMFENFDSHTGSTTGTANNLPDCWNYLNTGTLSTYQGLPNIYNSSTSAASGSNSLRFYTYTSSTTMGDQYAILPRVDVTYNPLDNLQITMDVRKYSTSYTNFTLIVGVMSDPTDVTTFVPVDTVIQSTTTYEEHTVMFNHYTGTGEYVAMYAPKVTPSNVSYNAGYVDNISLEVIPSCIKPTGVTLSNITATGVDVNWTPGDMETAWEIVAVPTGTPVTSGVSEYATSHPYTLSNLNDDTQYDVYVRADCGGGDYSSWATPVSFTTDPLCTAPTNLTISSIAGASAEVSWNAAPVGAVNYTVEYSEAGMDQWTPAIVNGTSYMLSYLNPQTSYDVRVFSNCDLSSADTLTQTFTTKCLAGGEVQIGNGTTTNYRIPVNNYYHYSYSQQIFLASEMNGPQTLNSVSFEYAYTTAMTSKTNVNIYLGHTTQSTFPSNTDFVPTTNMQLVYSGSLNCQQGWNTFNFTTPFQYNGTDNLVLAVDDNSDAYNGTAYVFRVHAAGATRTLYYNSDSYNPDPADLASFSGTKTISSDRSNVKFGGDCDSLTTCIAPNVYVSGATDESITLAWAPGYMENAWDLEYSTDDTTWTSVGTLTNMTYVLDNLNANTLYYIRVRSNCGGSDFSNWSKVQKRTECGPIGIPLVEGFESAPGSGAGNMITCWSTLTNHTSQYPYTNSGRKYTGTYSVFFYGTETNYSYLITPRFSDEVQMDNLQISFWAFKNYDNNYMQMGVMSDPEDLNTFVQIGGRIAPVATQAWEYLEVNTSSYTGNGHYIAFRVPNDIASNYISLDDINIDVIPACPHVDSIQLDTTTLTSTSADIIWVPFGTETQWEYVVAPAGTVTNPENETSTTVYTASASLTGLVANTSYDIFVRANCSSDENSTWEMYTFRTECDAISSLPFVENFDTYGTGSDAWMSCWSKINTYLASTNLPYISSSSWGGTAGADGSVGYLYFYTNTSGTYELAITPPFDSSIPVNTLRAKFKYKRHNNNGIMVVGVLTDPNDGNTFVAVDTVTAPTVDVWTDTHVDFSSYTGTGTYIAFKCFYNTTSTYSMVDNLSINTIPNCLEPSDFMISAMDSVSATLSWSAVQNENQWELFVVPADSSLENATPILANDTFVTVTGLTPATTYDAYLHTVCSTSGYSDYVILQFTTSCVSYVVTEYDPYVETFNTLTEGIPTCWDNSEGTTTNEAQKWNYYATGEHGACLRFNSFGNANGNTNMLKSAVLDLTALTTPMLSFSYKNPTGGDFSVYLSTDGGLTYTTPLATGLTGVSAWTRAELMLPNMNDASNVVVVFKGTSNYGGGDAYIYLDSVVVGMAAGCLTPSNVSVSSLTSDGATITWGNVTDEAIIELYYKEHSGNVYTTVTSSQFTDANTYQMSGLQPGTRYDVYVAAICNDDTLESALLTFITPCVAISTLPYMENFDSYSAATSTTTPPSNYPNDDMPDCWSFINRSNNSGSYPNAFLTSSSTYAASGNCLFFRSSSTTPIYSVLPAFVEPLQNLQITFTYRNEGTTASNGTLSLGYMTDISDISTFVEIASFPQITTLTEETVVLNTVPSDVTDANIVFKYTGGSSNNYYVSIDNVTVEMISTCAKPRDLEVMPASTSATLSWVEMGDATSWDIEYGNQGFALGSGTMVTATTNPFTINNLTPATTYDFYVRANCGGGDESGWRGPVTTTPGSYNFPTSGQYTLSMCGGVLYDDGGPDGNYSISCDVTVVVNPDTVGLYVQLNGTYEIETGTSSRWDYLQIFDGPDNTGTILFDSQNHDDLTNITSTTGPLTLYFHSDASITKSGFEIQVACVENTTPPQCNAPTNVTATNVTHESAVIDWTQEGTPDSWTISYKKGSASSWTTINTTTHPYTITNLDAETSYNVYVTATCGEQTSSQSATITFVTQPNSVNDYEMNTTLYPNPTTGEIRIQNTEFRIQSVEVYDVYGKLIKTVKVDDHSVVIDLSANASGVYFTRIMTDKGMVTKRVVKK